MTPAPDTLKDFLVLHEANRTAVTVTWATGGVTGHVSGVPRVTGDAVAFPFPSCERREGETFVQLAHVAEWGNPVPANAGPLLRHAADC
jgi:hypothetical protein